MDSIKNRFTISTDKSKLDIEVIHNFLKNSYWAENVPLHIVEKSIANSLCFGVYEDDKQVGFARVVSDYVTFAYIADVFIIEAYRRQGLGKWLVETILGHSELQGLNRLLLGTRNAHGLYQKYGFQPIAKPQNLMELRNPNIYT